LTHPTGFMRDTMRLSMAAGASVLVPGQTAETGSGAASRGTGLHDLIE